MTALDGSRLAKAFEAIDEANSQDPSKVTADGRQVPAERLYGERMSQTLDELYPEASEILKVAARAQHIKRWTVPRSNYPMDRTGYLRWRTELKRKHATLTGELMQSSGYSEEEVARAGALIRKERLKQNAESQALEDVACIVFLKHYVDEFAAKHDDGKLIQILRKTWVKMSSHGHQAALALPLSTRVGELVGSALQDETA